MNHVVMPAEAANILVKTEKGYEINGEFYTYHKSCKNPLCKNHMFTNSRGLAYCSPDCNKKHTKRKKQRRSAYGVEFKEAQRLLSRCYDVCKLCAELYYGPKDTWKCEKCGSTDRIQVHHRNLMPLDNRPDNLALWCTECHEAWHAQAHNDGIEVNTLEVFKEWLKYQEMRQGANPEEVWNAVKEIVKKGGLF